MQKLFNMDNNINKEIITNSFIENILNSLAEKLAENYESKIIMLNNKIDAIIKQNKWMNIAETADYLGISTSTLRKHYEKYKAVTVGGDKEIRFNRIKVDEIVSKDLKLYDNNTLTNN